MKKTFLVFLLLICLCFPLGFCVGCDKNYSEDDIQSKFNSLKTSNATKEVFNGNFIDINFDTTKVNINSYDKGYIFYSVYDYYIDSSSYLFFGVIDRIVEDGGNVAYIFREFDQKSKNNIYNALSNVEDSIVDLINSKNIYELSNGDLHYRQLLTKYNVLVESLYKLNETFADIYFSSSVSKLDFSKDELSNSNIRDMIAYELLKISKASFEYEILNYTVPNPAGSISSWYSKTEYVADYINLCQNIFDDLKNKNNLVPSFESYKEKLKNVFINMQSLQNSFDSRFQMMHKALYGFDTETYLNSVNKNVYVEGLSYDQQSRFYLIKDFFQKIYASYFEGLNLAYNYI